MVQLLPWCQLYYGAIATIVHLEQVGLPAFPYNDSAFFFVVQLKIKQYHFQKHLKKFMCHKLIKCKIFTEG